jgi:hypothetical protein
MSLRGFLLATVFYVVGAGIWVFDIGRIVSYAK